MQTTKTYQKSVYLSKLQSTISDILTDDNSKGSSLIVLDQTIFFPGGGGQSSDLGTISGLEVSEVHEQDGVIYHRLPFSPSELNSKGLNIGSTCEITIDWERRFDNMQRHCGEHILSGVCYSLWGGVNRGFHMGDDYMTIDISLEDNPKYSEITTDMLREAEIRANQIIWQDLPVVTKWYETKEDAAGLPLRKELTIERDITIVTIGDSDAPADSVACCGTHPSSSGQVGLIKIYKMESNKGMFRIYFDAGRHAFDSYQREHDLLRVLEEDLSAGPEDLLEKYQTRKDKNSEIRNRLFLMTKDVISKERDKILSAGHSADENVDQASNRVSYEVSNQVSDQVSNQVYRYDILTVDDLIELGRSLEGKIQDLSPGSSDLLFLVHDPSNTVLLFSDTLDCGKLTKDNVAVFNGKGGGNQKFARAIFTRQDDLDMFIEGITKLALTS